MLLSIRNGLLFTAVAKSRPLINTSILITQVSRGRSLMVAINRRRIHCVVVAVPVEADLFTDRGALAHELVPGADPYVALLIQRLQDEVRAERQQEQFRSCAGRLTKQARFEDHDLSSDLELPWFDMPLDDQPLGEENVPEYGDN
jgi:hypothetical protein